VLRKVNRPAGVVAYTEPWFDGLSDSFPLLNDTFGNQMNQNATNAGSPQAIHDGTDSVAWTGTNVAGSSVTFDSTTQADAGTKSVEVAAPSVGDVWQFAKGSTFVSTSYAAVTLRVYVDSGWGVGDEVSVYGYDTSLASTLTNVVLLNDYIDTGLTGAWQSALIPWVDLGIPTSGTFEFDAFRMELVSKQGAAPTFYIDTFQAVTGTDAYAFVTDTPFGQEFHVHSIVVSIADALAGTLTDGTMPGLAYDDILGVSTLNFGIKLRQRRNGVIVFNVVIRSIQDLLAMGFQLTNVMSDGTNTAVIATLPFPTTPLILAGGPGDRLEVLISDDLSGLLEFKALCRGALQQPTATVG